MELQIIGCGTSTGVPIPGCMCKVCRSTNPKNWRNRTSALIRGSDGSNILIDATPDLRHQALKWDIQTVNAVLFTHGHADHILGIDDLRAFNFATRERISCYANTETREVIRHFFQYIFEPKSDYEGGMLAQLDDHLIDDTDHLEICAIPIQAFPVWHGKMKVLGFRIGNVAYATDCNRIPPESEKILEGVEYLVLDGLRYKPHSTHFTLPKAIEAARRIGPKHTWFVHMTHDLDYEETNRELPEGFELAYDGLRIPINL